MSLAVVTHDLTAAREEFAATAGRFRSALADAWSEWATARIERIVVDQFATTAELSDDALTTLKRVAGMTIVGRSAQVSVERIEVLEAPRWEAVVAFDAPSARAEFDAAWLDLPAALLDALRAKGFDVAGARAAPVRSAAHRAYERAMSELLAAASRLVSAAEHERIAAEARSRTAARSRWSLA